DEELGAAAAAGALVVLDALDEGDRARAAGVETVLIRVTPGIEADTHHAIQTAQAESKFGLVADDAVTAVRDARSARLEVAGLHSGGRRHVRQSASAALRLALRSAVGEPRGRARLRDLSHCGQALRIRRRAHRRRRAAGAATRGPARSSGHGGLHARDGVELQ